jgi:hypothetical protein
MNVQSFLTFLPCSVSGSVSLPSFETVLFSLGVGLGVLFASSQQSSAKLLEETQLELQTLKLELARKESPSHTNRFDSANVSDLQP